MISSQLSHHLKGFGFVTKEIENIPSYTRENDNCNTVIREKLSTFQAGDKLVNIKKIHITVTAKYGFIQTVLPNYEALVLSRIGVKELIEKISELELSVLAPTDYVIDITKQFIHK